jgi:hypothetical protein
VARSQGTGGWRAAWGEKASHYTLLARSSALIAWRPQGRERRLSLWVDDRSQGGRCFNAGTSVARDNRLATSVQTHFFDSGSAAAVGRQERWTQRSSPGSPKGGGRWKTSRATVARGECASCAEKRTGEATYARGRKCENALELQGWKRARQISRPVYSKCTGEHTGQKETAL